MRTYVLAMLLLLTVGVRAATGAEVCQAEASAESAALQVQLFASQPKNLEETLSVQLAIDAYYRAEAVYAKCISSYNQQAAKAWLDTPLRVESNAQAK